MTYAYDETITTRTILGTDHPVSAVVYKAGRTWISATICNGIAESSAEFRTKREALAHASNKGGGLRYMIETRSKHQGWNADSVGDADGNIFDSIAEADCTIEELKKLGDDWAEA